MKEIVVISGKGGTGKTSISACFAALARSVVVADCDVDAADLHLVLEPDVKENHIFSGGKMASVIESKCVSCGKCAELCRFGAVSKKDSGKYHIDPVACEGCGVCAWFCPEQAVDFSPADNGLWFVSDTRFGTMVHARLGIAEENSGKLVSTVRTRAKEIAVEQDAHWLIVDGAPGIGCPVIASLSGADFVVIVTEPTVSGEHDFERVAKLAAHFGVPAGVVVNKADLNVQAADRITCSARNNGLSVLGRIGYDRVFTEAQINASTVVEYSNGKTASEIRTLWEKVSMTLLT